MRVHPPKSDVRSSTHASSRPYKCKKSTPKKSNVRSPKANVKFTVTMPLKVYSGNCGINVNNAETKVNGALCPRVMLKRVAITHHHQRIKTERPEHRIKTEQPEHKWINSYRIPKIKREQPEDRIKTEQPEPKRIKTDHSEPKRIKTEQPEPKRNKTDHSEPKRNKTDHSEPKRIKTDHSEPKQIKTEQPEHRVASSAHPKPTKEEHADKSVARPTVETVEDKDWLQQKRVYIDMVRSHMDEYPADDPTSVHPLKTELLNLMTSVAGQTHSNSTQWQHPSDLTVRSYRKRFEQSTPVVSLREWKDHQDFSTTVPRFYGVPRVFTRTPVYL